MKNGVCAIIVTYNTGRDLLQCFMAIKNQVEEVVIVDNGSEELTLSILNELKNEHRIKVIYNDNNMGIAFALNVGVKYSISKKYEWVLTLDHDSVVTPTMVEDLLAAYRTLSEQDQNKLGIISARPVHMILNEVKDITKFKCTSICVNEVVTTISSGSLIKTNIFQRVGFFRESLFMYYVDDDMCLRCQNENIKIFSCQSAILLHREGAKELRKFLWKTIAYNNYDAYAMYYIFRNSIYMLKEFNQYHKYRYLLIKRLARDFVKVLLYDKNRLKIICVVAKGVFDGLCGRWGKLKTV